MYFLKLIWLNVLIEISFKFLPKGPIATKSGGLVSIGLGNGLVPNRQQTIA